MTTNSSSSDLRLSVLSILTKSQSVRIIEIPIEPENVEEYNPNGNINDIDDAEEAGCMVLA